VDFQHSGPGADPREGAGQKGVGNLEDSGPGALLVQRS